MSGRRHQGESRITAPSITLIGGATASGKSAFALDLARRTGAVIVNADSQQLYRGLGVLTAAPTPAERRLAPHRLYQTVDPSRAWSVGRWLRAVEKILAEARRPLVLVGGTGLYFNALTRGLAHIPPVPDEVRQDASEAFDRMGEETFRELLVKVDPEAAGRIAPGDRQRLVRALGVALATGKPLSRWQAETTPVLEPGGYAAFVVERDRQDLYARCDARVDAMVAGGALEEVEALLALGLDPDRPVMKAVGVRELAAHLQGEMSLDAAVAQMKTQTRQYAKRQLTWFRNQALTWTRVP